MKKWIFSLSLIVCSTLSNSGTQFMIEHSHDIAPQKFSEADSEYLEPSSVESQVLKVKGMSIKGFDQVSLKKVQDAFVVLEKVVNSAAFKDRVINFKNTKGQRAFASNDGMSNEQIYEIFMEGRETLQKDTPGEMNFFLSLYNKRFSKVIGWTNPTINTININWKFFRNNEVQEVASNFAHEWTHKIGFGHASASEHDSAPYAIGYIVEEMAGKILKNKVELH